jgi:hypothetical protein
MPTVRSICQGGIWRRTTFSLIDRAQGRASLYVSNGIGAIDPGRWQFWHDRSRIGATSLLNVTGLPKSAAYAATAMGRSRSSIRTKQVMLGLLPNRAAFGTSIQPQVSRKSNPGGSVEPGPVG